VSYQILPNVILLLSILGILVLILRRLPEASELRRQDTDVETAPQRLLAAKGLPARAASRGKTMALLGVRRVWNFMLEAKGLRQGPAINYKIKKIWRRKADAGETAPPVEALLAERDEQYFLDQIKKFPKDLEGYNRLGQYYLGQKNFEEALNVYDYLIKHRPTQSDYWARLAYSQLQLRQYDAAVVSYEKSLGLDKSHPNRYYNLALAFNALSQGKEAVGALEQALHLEPANVKYMQTLAEIYHTIGEPDKAREVSRRIARLDSASESDPDTTNPAAQI
jgi:tetratricopeptide (TPR) repeat protein